MIVLTLASGLGALGGLGCKSEPSSAAGKNGSAAEDDQGDQQLFDRERQPEAIIKALGLAPGKVVADIGAGTGLLTVHVARAVTPGGHVVATDIDGGVLELLRARMEAAGFAHIV